MPKENPSNSKRDDFTAETRRKLAERAGFRCSFPNCGAVTIGPSEESSSSTSSTGMACHISAASSGAGARRYNPKMSSEDRCSINNGIWMCYKHGKLIDTDENRFTTEQLQKWRDVAEKKAQLRHDLGEKSDSFPSFADSIGLPSHELLINDPFSDHIKIGLAIKDSAIAEIWGKQYAHDIRDLANEIARNAFVHGGASKFEIRIERDCVRLIDDGNDYDPFELVVDNPKSGGQIAMTHIARRLTEKMLVVPSRQDDKNVLMMALVSNSVDIEMLTECYVEITWSQVRDGFVPYSVQESCKVVYVILPWSLTISDCLIFCKSFEPPKRETRPIIFVLENTSSNAREILESHFPGHTIMVLE